MGKSSRKDRSLTSRGSDSSEDENLRGKYRELQKEVKRLRSYVDHLERELLNRIPKVKETVKRPKFEPEIKCDKCGHNEIKALTIYRPDGAFVLSECQNCGHREKVHGI